MRGMSKRRSGGQTGHPGATSRQAENPHRVIDHVPNACHRCREEFPEDSESEGYDARQVRDAPEPKLAVEEHGGHSLRRDRGAVTEETFPKAVNARVKQCPSLTGTAACPHACRRPPLRRPEGPQVIEDMFGVPVSEDP